MEIGGHQLDKTFGLVILLLIPIFISFFRKQYKSTIILGFLFCLSFAEGSLELLGILEPSYNRIIREILILVGFFKIAYKTGNKLFIPGKWIVILLILISLYSFFINESNVWQYILFIRRMSFNFFLLYFVANITFTDKTFNKLYLLIIGLFVIQIPISLIKFLRYGIGENYIGSISTIAGSITTTITLIAISYLLTLVLNKTKSKYIILIFLFLLFAIIGAKRAILIFVPILAILSLLYSGKFKIKQLFFISLFLPIAFIFMLKTSPSLNPENKVWGSFSPQYVLNYINSRTNAARAIKANQSNSRILVFSYVANNFTKDTKDIFLGQGPGIVFPKNSYDLKKYGTGEKYLLNKYGLGYGMRIGLLWLFFQSGLLFVILYFFFHYILYKQIKEKVNAQNLLFLKLLLSVFIIDTFLHSSTFITPSAVAITFYTILGLYLNRGMSNLIRPQIK